tara:strand:- start:275 stop:487 length:213 start_codon:yes stop_codon:yes gene_type:complete
MESLDTITRNTIKTRGLKYTPSLFNDVLSELKKSRPNYNSDRDSHLMNNPVKQYMVSFMELKLTSDKRLK